MGAVKVICFYDLDSNRYDMTDAELEKDIDSLMSLLTKGNGYKSNINYELSKIARYNDYVAGVSVSEVEWELSGQSYLRAVCALKDPYIADKAEKVLQKVILDVLNGIVYENKLSLSVRPDRTKVKECVDMKAVEKDAKKLVSAMLEGKTFKEAVKLLESGSVDDDKVTALLQFLDLDPDNAANRERVHVLSYNDNMYYIDDDNNMFLVCTDEEADEEHLQGIENIYDDIGLDAFSPAARDYILENFADEEPIIDFYQDDMRSYAEDINSEDEMVMVEVEDPETGEKEEIEAHNRLLKELIENGYVSDLDFEESEFNEDGEYIGDKDLVEIWCDNNQSPEDAGYDSAYEWLEFEFGKDWAKGFVQDHCDLDLEAVSEYIAEEDGRGNELNGWDGSEHEEDVDGTTYYIYPQCDWESLDLSDGFEDDGSENLDTGEE